MSRAAVVGSRTFDNYSFLEAILNTIRLRFTLITEIISGGAKGADSLAETYARRCNLKITVYKPDWDKYGKGAGFIRNASIVEEADMVIAFWDGKSKGTKDTIDKALKAKKNTFVFFFEED